MLRKLSCMRCMLVLAAMLVASYAPWTGMSQRAGATGLPVAAFAWSMLPRFPETLDGRGVPVMPNNRQYADPADFGLAFAGCLSTTPNGSIVAYQWQVRQNGVDVHPDMIFVDCIMTTRLPQGKYDVTLTVTDSAGQTASQTQNITVKDYLIVAIGDSWGSGQGNPDIRGNYWDLIDTRDAQWMDERCNRSHYAGAYQAAKRLEDADPHTSVTFIFLSCSGATVARGLIGPYAGAEPPPFAEDLPPQVDQVRDIVGTRTIDALLISVGGNDVNFAGIIVECVSVDGCWGNVVDGKTLAERLPEWLNNLTGWTDAQGYSHEGWYSKLNTEIHLKLRVSNIYLSEYANPLHDLNGDICPSLVDDILPSFKISHDEAAWLEANMARPLNAAIAATTHWGWHPVVGIAAPFEGVVGDASQHGHGYCSSERWIRTATESADYQGRIRLQTQGTMHPNEQGHQVYAHFLYDAVTANLPGATPEGTNVIVTPQGVGSLPGPFFVHFGIVREAGVTRVETSTGGSLPPSGLRPGHPAIVYDVTTTAQFDGGARTCINYSSQTFADESHLKLHHWENGAWADRTSTLDTVNNVICAWTSSLSPFAVFQPDRPPTAQPGGPYSVDEGKTVQLTGAGSDPEGDALTYAWDLDNNGTYETANRQATFSAQTLDGPANKTVGLKVCGTYGACGTATTTVAVKNVAPVPGTMGVPELVALGEAAGPSYTFTDAGIPDTHAVVWDWGDGTQGSGTVQESSGSGTARGTHVYAQPGAYTAQATVSDDDGGKATATYRYAVVYNPSVRFAAGSGWINSSAGAYAVQPAATGQANFGFACQAPTGSPLSGNTEFQFAAAGLNFHSTKYTSLSISLAGATIKGEGTINGAGQYLFQLTAVQGDAYGGDGNDKFSIKIWDKASGAVVYDNRSPIVLGDGGILMRR